METGKEKEKEGLIINGSFPAQQFFNTLAAILSRRENADITAAVIKEGEEQQKAVV